VPSPAPQPAIWPTDARSVRLVRVAHDANTVTTREIARVDRVRRARGRRSGGNPGRLTPGGKPWGDIAERETPPSRVRSYPPRRHHPRPDQSYAVCRRPAPCDSFRLTCEVKKIRRDLFRPLAPFLALTRINTSGPARHPGQEACARSRPPDRMTPPFAGPAEKAHDQDVPGSLEVGRNFCQGGKAPYTVGSARSHPKSPVVAPEHP
jgi:hypothetical protein